MKKQTKTSLKKKCDTLYSLIIRSKGYCEVCGKTENLQTHHVIGRINYILRWDLRNGVCADPGCHMLNRNSAHNNPIFFINWFKSTRPDDYEYLLTKKNTVKTFNILDYQQILKNLKEAYDTLNS